MAMVSPTYRSTIIFNHPIGTYHQQHQNLTMVFGGMAPCLLTTGMKKMQCSTTNLTVVMQVLMAQETPFFVTKTLLETSVQMDLIMTRMGWLIQTIMTLMAMQTAPQTMMMGMDSSMKIPMVGILTETECRMVGKLLTD